MAVETVVKARPSASPQAEAWRRLRRNPLAMVSAVIIVSLIILAIFAPWIAPYAYDEQGRSYAILPSPPDSRHRLGVDNLGQDILSRLIFGASASFWR